jgi:hypothetical protein
MTRDPFDMNPASATVNDVARYLVERFRRHHVLCHADVVQEVIHRFGLLTFIESRDGAFTLKPEVLEAFQRITKGRVKLGPDGYWR